MEKNILNNYKVNHKIDLNYIEEKAAKLKILIHPVRFAIIMLLIKNNKMTVTDIYHELSMQQAAVSNHLKLMKTNGVLCSERDGQKIFYTVNNEILKTLYECVKLNFYDKN